jgi:hypothetical protein
LYDLVDKVVSKAKFSFPLSKVSMRSSIIRPASKATFSGWNGDNPNAILSAFTNSLQSKISGKIVNDAVVFPAPLQPEMI